MIGWIIFGILSYLSIGILAIAIGKAYDPKWDDDKECVELFLFGWPLLLFIIIGFGIRKGLTILTDYLGKYFRKSYEEYKKGQDESGDV